LCPEAGTPTVDVAIAFGHTTGGGGQSSGDDTWISMWYPALKHYSQVWVVRLLPSGRIHLPLDFRKLLCVVEMELSRGVAKATAIVPSPRREALGPEGERIDGQGVRRLAPLTTHASVSSEKRVGR
jgi:hypothetical protein